MLRPATDSDVDAMLPWRNHPEVRRVSLTQHEIAPDEHATWWKRTRRDPTRRVLIYERNGVRCGVVTFFDVDTDAGTGWWGYYLDNAGLEERGELMPAWIAIQREAVKFAFGELGLGRLDGETLADNTTVVAFNNRMGFEVVETYTRQIDGAEKVVVHTRRTAPEAGK